MKKNNFVVFILLAALFAVNIPLRSVFSFFSGSAKQEISGASGSVKVDIENLTLDENEVITGKDLSLNDGILRLNSSQMFSFTLKNNGLSSARVLLAAQLSWDNDLSESGKLFVYPVDYDDETIYNNLKKGDQTGAVIGAISDKNEIEASTGIKYGIEQIIDYITLEDVSSDDNYKNYAFKLFFYGDEEVSKNPFLFSNSFLEVGLRAYSDVEGKTTNWAHEDESFFRTVSAMGSIPAITEVESLPKTFFVTQADIDLKSYATASDEVYGNITDKIEITSSPSFGKNPGVYTITYNVKNDEGIYAAPLQIKVEVWGFIKIVSGNSHALALTSHGKVYAWGRNVNGQLGDGSNVNRSTPVLVSGLNNIADIGACNSSSYALTKDGQLYSWGHNGYGHLGDGTIVDKNKPVAVQQNGVIFTKFSAHFNTVGAIADNGDVYTWGYGGYGAAGTGVHAETNPLPQKIGLSNVARLDFGNHSGAALTNDGKFYAWGGNTQGQLGGGFDYTPEIYAPTKISYFEDNNIEIAQFSLGSYHAAAVSADGRLFTWGHGAEGRLGDGGTINKNSPQYIALPSKAVRVSAGYNNSGVITDDDLAYVFGDNSYGKLGTGNTADSHVPILFAGVDNVSYICTASDATFAFSSSAILYGAGSGTYGMLATGTAESSAVAVKWAFTPPAPY